MACMLGALLWAQPDLFYNQGALVYVQANALVYVQGGMVTNDNAGNQGILENFGTIELVNDANTPNTWRGNFTIGSDAEVNSRPGSIIRIQGDYHNNQGFHRSTGSHPAPANQLGGTVEFNASNNGPQVFRISMPAAATDPQRWMLNDVIINLSSGIPLANRHVQIFNGTDRDMWIRGTLTLTRGRIHTEGSNLSNNNPTEVRVLNTAAGAIVRNPATPVQPANFSTLDPDNQDKYIFGRLRREVVAGTNYMFYVGGPHNTLGIQAVEVRPAENHFVQARFDPTSEATFSYAAYCRSETNNRSYIPLNNGRWQIRPFADATSTTPSNPAGPERVTMYNRVVSNATADGQCPNAGATTGLPGDPPPANQSDPVYGQYPSNLCYIGYAVDRLTPPNYDPITEAGCEGHNNGWTVTRSNFSSYNPHNHSPGYFFATVITANSPLPSDDLRLSAAPAGSAIALTWEVTPEREYVLGYELYRSTDGVSFSKVAQIDKQGRIRYHHLDTDVKPMIRYFYRVEQHDVLGNVTYSNVAEAMLSKASESFSVQFYPQPTMNEGYLQVLLPADGLLTFELYDALGKLVVGDEYRVSAGAQQINLTPLLSRIALGTYTAVVRFGDEVRLLRLMKVAPTR